MWLCHIQDSVGIQPPPLFHFDNRNCNIFRCLQTNSKHSNIFNNSNMFKHLQFVAMERPPYPNHPSSTPSYCEGSPKVKTMLLWHFPLIDTCKGKYLWRAYFRYEVVSWKSLICVTLLPQPRTHDFTLYDFAKICKSQQTPLRNWQNSSSTYYLAICFHISLTTQFENFNTKII